VTNSLAYSELSYYAKKRSVLNTVPGAYPQALDVVEKAYHGLSLITKIVNYGHKKVNNIGPW